MNRKVFRCEYKYLINAMSAELLRRSLGALIDTDAHAGAGGDYFVRSVYFDDEALSAYHDKLAGVSERNKYRIRFYNMDESRFYFEAKRKRDRYVSKDSAAVSREDTMKLLAGMPLDTAALRAPVLREFDALSRGTGMLPSVIVDYVRTAFCYPVGDVRITLDRDLCAESFAMENVFVRRSGVPVLNCGETVLEVKYTGVLPPMIAQVLSTTPKILCANSKYCNCLAVYL